MRSSILKQVTVLLTASISCYHSNAFSQTYAYVKREKIDTTIPQRSAVKQLSSVLKSLEAQFNVRFNYNTKLMKDKTIREADVPLEGVLEDILNKVLIPHELSYEKVQDNSYVIVKAASADDVVVKGRVTDAKGEPLPGVSIKVKGGSKATTSDINGNFSLSVSEGDAVLVFGFVGFKTAEVAIKGRAVVNVTLTDDSRAIDEVVVVGYGTQKRSDITGSVAVVSTSEMKKVSTNDVGNLLQGRASGVSVNSDGQPGAFPQVRIRGIGTFNNSDPLYVIDGIPVNGVPRDFNPNDIESLQVLKDASAGAVYGSRAANGVIIITTKQGRKNSPLKIEYAGYYGVDEVWQKVPVTSTPNYQALNNEARYNAGKALAPANDPNSSKYITNINTDWQKEGLKTGDRQNHNVNFSGGGNNTTYNVSMDYFDNNGTFVGNGPSYERYTGRVNTTAEKGIFKMGQSLFYSRSHENALTTGGGVLLGARPPLINDLVFAIPTLGIYDDANDGGFSGTLQNREDAISLNGIGFNSLVKSTTDADRTFGTLFGEIQLLKLNGHSLKYKINFGYDRVIARDFTFTPTFNLGYFFPNITARLNDNTREYGSRVIENTLNYEKAFGKHSLSVLAGQMYQRDTEIWRFGYAQGFTKPYFPTLANGSSSTASGGERYHVLSSYLGRLNYNYADRYLLTATMRRDGSTRFAPVNRLGYFPSMAVGWKLTNEPFFKVSKDIISDLKVRASWGVLGNENIGDYQFAAFINPNMVYTFDNMRVLGGLQTNVVSETIKWEERETKNIGFDAKLLRGLFDISAEYYNSISRDILVGIPIPASVGSINSNPIVNAGSLQNKGIELSVSYHKRRGKFNYDVSGNLTTVKNTVLNLGTNVKSREGVGSISELGGEVGRHYGWVTEGLFQSKEEIATHAFQDPGTSVGDIKFQDLNNDGIINDLDRTYLGSGIPKYIYGLNFSGSYKSFDFTVFASGSAKFLINSRLYRDLMHSGGDANYHEDILNRWTTVNTNTNIPRLNWNDPNQNFRNSDREGWLQDGTFLRLNTISLGYTLPKKIVKKVSNARIYVTAQNIYTFQKYKSYNPDFTAGVLEPGYDNGSYPKPRTLMMGVQLGF